VLLFVSFAATVDGAVALCVVVDATVVSIAALLLL